MLTSLVKSVILQSFGTTFSPFFLLAYHPYSWICALRWGPDLPNISVPMSSVIRCRFALLTFYLGRSHIMNFNAGCLVCLSVAMKQSITYLPFVFLLRTAIFVYKFFPYYRQGCRIIHVSNKTGTLSYLIVLLPLFCFICASCLYKSSIHCCGNCCTSPNVPTTTRILDSLGERVAWLVLQE